MENTYDSIMEFIRGFAMYLVYSYIVCIVIFNIVIIITMSMVKPNKWRYYPIWFVLSFAWIIILFFSLKSATNIIVKLVEIAKKQERISGYGGR